MNIIDGEWEYEDLTGSVMTKNPTGSGRAKVCDVRGWGHLTGKGARGLTMEEAEVIQDNTGRLIAAAPSLAKHAKGLIDFVMEKYELESVDQLTCPHMKGLVKALERLEE